MDTVALVWGNQGGSEVLSAVMGSPNLPFARGVLVLEKLYSGARVMAWPEFGVLKVEGRLGAIIDGDRESHRLADPSELPKARGCISEQLREALGAAPVSKIVGVGRYDLAVEGDFEPEVGLGLLRAMRALRPPGYKLDVITAADGTVQTVAVVTERRAQRVFRAYDKSVESGSGPAGSRIRFEAQVRRSKQQRRSLQETSESNLRHAFGRTIEPFLKGEPVVVTSPSGVVDQVIDRVADETLSFARAERLIGSAELLRRFGRGIYADDKTSARRLRALRDAGIAVDDELPEGATVAVTDLLDAALAEWTS